VVDNSFKHGEVMTGKRNCLFDFFLIILGFSALLGIIIIVSLLYFIVTDYPTENMGQITELGLPQSMDEEEGKFDETRNEEMWSLENESENLDQTSPDWSNKSTLDILDTTTIPENDPIALAEKYRGIINAPVMLVEPPITYINGKFKKFWVLNVDENNYRSIDAELAYQTPHVYFWVEEGVNYLPSDVNNLVDVFENQIYQRNREIFGKEWSPGIDNDVHLTILYAQKLGGAAGYFSSTDSLMPEIEKFSNMAEMFYLSADYINLSDLFAYGVLAHEFQHMIHWNIDRNEASWVNEGLSELAVELNGFTTGGFSFLFAAEPDLQLNFWPGNDQGDSTPHYGASYLFIKYLFERFGSGFIGDLVSQRKNGMQGLDAELSLIQEKNQQSTITSEQIFQDWTIANLLQNDEIANGIYGYGKGSSIPSFSPTEIIECGSETVGRTVNQFGTDFVEISCESDYEILVQWNQDIPVLSENPKSGKYYYWSNAGDESGMRLSREFDLTEVSGHVELSYWAWYDIEEDYDYLYMNVSEDGKNWHMLKTPSCTSEDPTGSNLGCGYNGKSAGWIEEVVDLSDYAGKKIIVEFEYITDASVNGEGFLLDDVELNVINFLDDFEISDGKWIAEGFVRIENALPQIFSVSVIEKDRGMNIEKFFFKKQTEILYIVKNSDEKMHEIVVISGLSRFTHIPARYEISILRID
jgi:hypothetical protein